MLNKCVTTRATLIVPDMEDSVPPHEKPGARKMIKSKLDFIRSNAFSKRVVITPRTNGLETGLFFDDVKGVLDKQTASLIDGFCIPKVDTVEDVKVIDDFLTQCEKELDLDHN
mmetsp:Transcript_77679/g.107438  ORF Transcript_77679/g.107438 Transcript_77679/m.107438 type:complete len:113 (-) Transcript_77679:535-873(-)